MSAVPYEKIVEEDLNLGTDTVQVTMPAGGTATGTKISGASFGALGFAATAPGTQSLAASTLSTVEITSEEFDTKAWFNPGTYTFTPQKAGYYQFNLNVSLAALTGTLTVGLYKNGVLVDSRSVVCSAAVGSIGLGVLVVANGSTDAFVIKATQTSAGAITVSAGRFSGVLVGGL